MEDKEAPNSAFTMSIKGMAMLTVCSVFSLRNLPSMAEYGWNIIFFLSAAAACFFIPSALVSAELASTYPQRGGVFIWAKEAFGPKLGFLAGGLIIFTIIPLKFFDKFQHQHLTEVKDSAA